MNLHLKPKVGAYNYAIGIRIKKHIQKIDIVFNSTICNQINIISHSKSQVS